MKPLFKIWRTLFLFVSSGLLMMGQSSCMDDEEKDCILRLKIRYVYNMQQADGLSMQANAMTVYVFDAQKKFVLSHHDEVDYFGDDYTCELPNLPSGNYTFVAMARSRDKWGEFADFQISELQKGDAIECLTARLPRDAQGETHSQLNHFLIGTSTVYVTGTAQTVGVDLMKCTNTLRVILVPMMNSSEWSADDFDIYIEGQNGWLSYDGSPYRLDPIIYRPYYQEVDVERTGGLLVAEMNTSRLMYSQSPRLVVRNRKLDCEIFNINLTGLLSLQAIGEHQAIWSHQEYLDRQDEYALTFITNGYTWMQTKIVVNGWVLSLDHIGL